MTAEARSATAGSPKGSFSGADLSRALLKIWLGESPVQSDLKAALLAGR
ncbi:MAG: chalcone isomerase family protein [Myxococcota bacterium]